MIYTIICDAYGRDISVNKRDCHITRQPLPCLSQSVQNYIDKANNKEVKSERFCAYVSLFSALKCFFELDDPEIERASTGKPYIKDNNKIFFNISHSEGVCAITISDEGEVGVDIQAKQNEDRESRLEKRFLPDLTISKSNLNIRYFLCEFVSENVEFSEINIDEYVGEDFLAKWVYSESLIKLTGCGFSEISSVGNIGINAKVEIKEFQLYNKKYALANGIKKQKTSNL